MTIRSVRIYYYPLQKRRERWLTHNYWGWSEWFDQRLKLIREDLRGPDVKGVDIVNLNLREERSHVRNPGIWVRALNTLQFDYACDLLPLERGDKLDNLELLMGFYASVATTGPWPQLKAVARSLAAPLSDGDRAALQPFLQWPRQVGRLATYAT
jgi:hypothetical protein